MHINDDIDEDKEKLWDINEIDVNKFDTIENKTERFVEDTDGNIVSHINDGYVVRNYFADEGCSATEALINYIKKIAEVSV